LIGLKGMLSNYKNQQQWRRRGGGNPLGCRVGQIELGEIWPSAAIVVVDFS